MKSFLLLAAIALATSACEQARDTPSAEAPEPQRTVAVTVDDLPATLYQPGQRCEAEAFVELTERLTRVLATHGAEVTGFVVESRICDDLRPALLSDLLAKWLDAGHDLGNHTFSHRNFAQEPLEEFEADVVRGETTATLVLESRGKSLRYFRYPFLERGPDPDKRDAFERFLAGRGYAVAPVTVDNEDWRYARAYDLALGRGDSAFARRLGEDYLRHMDASFEFAESLSRDVVGREVPQILLLHASRLNADYFGDLAALVRERGYEFVSLHEAMRDSVYARPNPDARSEGDSWLQRLRVGMGEAPRPEPRAPGWVSEAMRE